VTIPPNRKSPDLSNLGFFMPEFVVTSLGVDLSGADLTDAELDGVMSVDLTGALNVNFDRS
jgi:uncharacterized protein YjbI with pentapeptide repeats